MRKNGSLMGPKIFIPQLVLKNNWNKPEKKNKLGDLQSHREEMIT